MYDIVAKVGWTLAQPAHLILIVLVLGVAMLWSPWPYTGRRLASIGTVALLAVAILPLSAWTLRPLEDRFAAPDALPPRVDGIIVLGGSVSLSLSEARGQPAVKGNVERLISFVDLARRYPEARLLFAGGGKGLTPGRLSQADVARGLLANMGLDTGRVAFERKSSNTHENALFGRSLAEPQPGEVWLLITSARHMPRAVGVFRRQDWPVVPYPVDYRTSGGGGFGLGFRLSGGLVGLTEAAKEWLGLAVYRILGRTTSVFPGPDPA